MRVGDISEMEETMENNIEQAKLDVAEFMHTEAKKQRIQLADIRWWSDYPIIHWDVEVKASNGRTAYQKFSPKQLMGFQKDNRLKVQVHAKVTSIIVHLQ
jgi:hypothetical protein